MTMTREILSLAKYLSSSRNEFSLLEMKQYLERNYSEKDLYAALKPHLYEMDIFCGSDYKCRKLEKRPLPSDEIVIRELEATFKNPVLPLAIEKLIMDYIERSCGKNWYRGEISDTIRKNIVRQKEEYWKGKKSQYPVIRIISYLFYHFPVYFCQFQFLLLELFKKGLLTNRMSIIDAGAGPGTITLAALDFIRKLQGIYSRNNMSVLMNIRIGSIEERKENIECYEELTSNFIFNGNINITIDKPIHTSLEKAPVSSDADLIIFSNVLAELTASPHEKADIVDRMASSCRDPTLIIVEPADLENSKSLRITQHALMKKGYNVYSPCSFIWGRSCSGSNCWSFQSPGIIKAPDFMKTIADTPDFYRYLNVDMKFSSVILRKDGLSKHIYKAEGKFMALSHLKKHIGKNINAAAAVMSGNLGDEKTFVFKICDGTASIPCYAVIPSYHISENNRSIIDAGYGDIVEIYGAHVRENKKQASFNLFMTRNSIVSIVSQ